MKNINQKCKWSIGTMFVCAICFTNMAVYAEIDKGMLAGTLGEADLIPKAANGHFNKTLIPLNNKQRSQQYFMRAVKNLANGRKEEAKNNLNLSLSNYSRNVQARELLSTLLVDAGQISEAIKLLLADAEGNVIPMTSVLLAATIYAHDSKAIQAVALLEKFRSQYHANIQYDLMLSALYYQAAAYTKAQTLYRKLLQKNPNNGLLWLGLAVSLEADMHRSDAVKAYQQAIKNNISENELRSFVVNKINVLTSGSDVVEDQAG